MTDVQAVTKAGVEEVVGRVVGEIVGDALQLISKRFDEQDEKFTALQTDVGLLKEDVAVLRDDVRALEATTSRIENKLNPTIDQVDDHEVRIGTLEHAAA